MKKSWQLVRKNMQATSNTMQDAMNNVQYQQNTRKFGKPEKTGTLLHLQNAINLRYDFVVASFGDLSFMQSSASLKSSGTTAEFDASIV